MRQHLQILARLLKDADISQQSAAERIGHKSGSTVGMMLRGERGMSRNDLESLCALVGITVVDLAAMSDDLIVTKHPESARLAALVDKLPAKIRLALLQSAEAYENPNSDR